MSSPRTEVLATASSFPAGAFAAKPDNAQPAFLTLPVDGTTFRTSEHCAPGSAKPAGIGLGQPGPMFVRGSSGRQSNPILDPEQRPTTQQAADILGILRPYLSKLLKSGKIPFISVGAHRRVMHADLMAYIDRRDAARHAALDDLAQLDQEFDAS